jgi:hypothetical protein
VDGNVHRLLFDKKPINPDFAKLADKGLIELFEGDHVDDLFDKIEKI